MKIKPFVDRFGRSSTIAISSNLTRSILPDIDKVVIRVKPQKTGSDLRQINNYRQGISANTFDRFLQTKIRPFIHGGDFTNLSTSTTAVDIFQIKRRDFGGASEFEESEPFKEKVGKFTPKEFLEDDGIQEYPQVYFDPALKSPKILDGIIEPIPIRETLPNSSESPFTSKRVDGHLLDGNIFPEYGGTSIIEQFVPITGSSHYSPYLDSPEFIFSAVTETGNWYLAVPGIIEETRTVINPFLDSRKNPQQLYNLTAAFRDRGLVDYLRKSATAGFVYRANPEGTDSVTYGGLFRTGSITPGNKLDKNYSGYISFIPNRSVISERSNATGSYPTVLRTTGRTSTLGNYKVNYDDTKTIIFASGVNCSYPSILRPGSNYMPLFSSSITGTAVMRSGLSDSMIEPYRPGVNIEPFDESRILLRTNSFYATGTSRSVLPGFSSPLWSKTQISIDLHNSRDLDVYFSTGSAPPGPAVRTGVNSGLAYYNFKNSRWETHGDRLRGVITGSNVNFKDNNIAVATGAFQAISLMQDLGSAPAQGYADLVNRSGRIVSNCGYPFDQKFNATGSQLLDMSKYIQHPFLVEKMVYVFSAAWGAREQGPNAVLHRAGVPFFSTFSVIRQSRKEISETVINPIQKGNGTSGAGYKNLTNNSNFIVTRRRDIIGYGDVVWTNSNETTASIWSGIKQVRRDLTLLPGYDSSPTDISQRLTGTFVLQFEGRVPAKSDNLGLCIGRIGNYGADNTATPNSAITQNYSGGGRAGTADFGLFMDDGRSVSGGVVGSNISGSKEVQIQGTTITQVLVSGSHRDLSPYIIFPEDQLTFNWINQNFSSSFAMTRDINMRLPAGDGKLMIFGSLMRDQVEYHDNINQPLTSHAIHESLHYDNPIVDQFEVESRQIFHRSYLDNYVTGTIIGAPGGVGWLERGIIGSFVSGTAGNASGSFERFVKLSSKTERFFDTLLPDFVEYAKRSGASVAPPRKRFAKSTVKNPSSKVGLAWFIGTSANPHFFLERGTNRLAFPYAEGEKRFESQKNVAVVTKPGGSGSNALPVSQNPNQTVDYLFRVGYSLPGLGGEGQLIYASGTRPGATGFRYGIKNIRAEYSSAHFRMSRYGQFRDMLEQRRTSRFFSRDGPSEPIVTVKFMKAMSDKEVAPIVTECANLSVAATSSLPFFDGRFVDRPDNPIETDLIKIV
tara:strand:- start:6049 stop:9603 length:3555 start_codon:yes stop_codon:yes gene_type:complete